MIRITRTAHLAGTDSFRPGTMRPELDPDRKKK